MFGPQYTVPWKACPNGQHSWHLISATPAEVVHGCNHCDARRVETHPPITQEPQP